MISSFIITGFLGVGKTTLLINSVQKHFPNKKVAIIVNEFGEIGVDSKILKNVHSDVLEISEGCVCCELASEFKKGVAEIIQKYSPEIILVETSGASEPFPIMVSMQEMGLVVEGTICVIDAKNFYSYKENSSAMYQIGGSNIIVFNKVDLVTNDELNTLELDIKKIKEQYDIKNSLTGASIFDKVIFHKSTQGIIDKDVFEGIYSLEDFKDLAKQYHHLDHTAKDSLTQKIGFIKEDVTLADIENLLSKIPQNIYRIKGVIKTSDMDYPLFVNYSFGDVTFENMTDFREKSLLVFIGQNITNEVFELDNQFDFLMIPRFRI